MQVPPVATLHHSWSGLYVRAPLNVRDLEVALKVMEIWLEAAREAEERG